MKASRLVRDQRYLKRNTSFCFPWGALVKRYKMVDKSTDFEASLPLFSICFRTIYPIHLVITCLNYKLELVIVPISQGCCYWDGDGMIILLLFFAHPCRLLTAFFLLLQQTAPYSMPVIPALPSPSPYPATSSTSCPFPHYPGLAQDLSPLWSLPPLSPPSPYLISLL